MKTKLLVISLFTCFMIFNCSVEEVNTGEFEQDPIDNIQTSKLATHKFSMKESGSIVNVKPQDCDSEGQYVLTGHAVIQNFGEFKTYAIQCTDFGINNYLKGWFDDGNNNILYFYSEKTDQDSNGRYYQYHFIGGTGKFAEVTGEINVYINENFNGSSGVYSKHAEGSIDF